MRELEQGRKKAPVKKDVKTEKEKAKETEKAKEKEKAKRPYASVPGEQNMRRVPAPAYSI